MREHHGLMGAWVGGRLRAMRGAQTQAEYAGRLGLSQAQYNRYETGKRLAPDWVIEQAAALRGVSAQEVLWGESPAPSPVTEPPLAGAVAELLAMLEREDLEDLYYFLKRKTEEMAAKRRKESRQAQAALEALKRAAGE